MSVVFLGVLAVLASVTLLVIVGIVWLALWLVRRSSVAEPMPAARDSHTAS